MKYLEDWSCMTAMASLLWWNNCGRRYAEMENYESDVQVCPYDSLFSVD